MESRSFWLIARGRFEHPQQVALALVWLGMWLSSLFVAGAFIQVAAFLVLALGVFVVGLPLLVLELVREGRR